MGGGDSAFAFKMLIFSMVMLTLLPTFLVGFVIDYEADTTQDELMEDYYNFTGASRGRTDEAVWVLTGVYTAFGSDGSTSYGYTQDNWLYGSRVDYYMPSQYAYGPQQFDVLRDDNTGIYYYATNSADYQPDETKTVEYQDSQGNTQTKTVTVNPGTGHKEGDLYTSVVMDVDKKSDIFFSKSLKYDQNGQRYVEGSNEPFYYEFTGWRYAWQPLADHWTRDADGNEIKVVATRTSLSLIWYSYYDNEGLSGQLVISGSDSGVSYLSSDQIIRAYDSTTSVARFQMTFNGGVQMGIYIKIDPSKLAEGLTVKQCYDYGYWSVMVTSLSTDVDSYMGTDYTLNVYNIFDTIIKLMTFDSASLGLSPLMGTICSYIIVIPLYAGLIALALQSWPALLIAGLVAAAETLVRIMTDWGWPF